MIVEQAAHVLAKMGEDSLARREQVWALESRLAFLDTIRTQYESEGHRYIAGARLWDDGVLDPLETRDTPGIALSVANQRLVAEHGRCGVLRM